MPVSIVTIKVKGGQIFHLHKDVLTQDSEYFDTALNVLFIEEQTQSIDLDDIEPEHFGLYVSLLYPTTLSRETVKLHDIWTRENEKKLYWVDLLHLWRLADRFLNSKILAVAKSGLEERFGELSVDRWLARYNKYRWLGIKLYVSRLNKACRLCINEDLPFEDDFVTGLSNCPPEVFAECMPSLDENIKTQVAVRFALRHASPTEMANKRTRDEQRETRTSTKKQKRDE